MSGAGFVLVGGASSRMGRDKALLPYEGTVLAERIAREVEAVAGAVILVGPPERYQHLGRRVVPDLRPGNGPLGGVEAALTASAADWNLIVACDMPRVTAALLGELMERAERSAADCLVPFSAPGRPEALCAVYHRRCLRAVTAALDANLRKVSDWLAMLRVARWTPPTAGWSENLNTGKQWAAHRCSTSATPSRPGEKKLHD